MLFEPSLPGPMQSGGMSSGIMPTLGFRLRIAIIMETLNGSFKLADLERQARTRIDGCRQNPRDANRAVPSRKSGSRVRAGPLVRVTPPAVRSLVDEPH
jgi:hypothetical protein